MKTGEFEFTENEDGKTTLDGFEIFPYTVEAQKLTPEKISPTAYWQDGSIIVPLK